MSAVLYWPLLVLAYRSKRLTLDLLRRCAIPAAFAFGGQVFWALAHYELQASEVGFLVRLSMVWAILGSMWMFRDERKLLFLPGFHLGVTLIVIGFFAMTYAGRQTEISVPGAMVPAAQTSGNYVLGVIWILLCGALFGLYMVAVRQCLSNIDPLLAFGVVANYVSMGTLAGMLMLGDVGSIRTQTPFSWMLMAASSLLGIALGHIMMYTAVQRLGAAITSCCQTLMPFLTAAIASVILAEALTTGQWLGGSVMVVGAIVLLSLKHEISEKPNETGIAAEA